VYQWSFFGDEGSVDPHGRLYTWYAVTDNRNVCPTGWHVPSDDEWTELTDFLGGTEVAAGKMKEEGTSNWSDPNVGATNESGFTAIPGGGRINDGTYYNQHEAAIYWTSTQYSETEAYLRDLANVYIIVTREKTHKGFGFSVRCLRD